MVWGLWVHETKDLDLAVSLRILNFARNHGYGLCTLSDQHARSLEYAQCLDHDAFFQKIQALIVLGGDGTMLSAAREAAPCKVPVLGVDLGHYGLLSECEPEQLEEALERLSQGAYRIEERAMLRGCVLDEAGNVLAKDDALNDFVLSGRYPVQMMHLCAKAANETLYQCACDGIVVATPTGSTAYSRSAGGPVIPPSVPCMAMTPLCSSSLASCPMVFSMEETLELTLVHSEEGGLVTVDGRKMTEIQQGQRLVIRRSEYTTPMIRIYRKDFYQRLQEKWDVWAHDRYQ